MSKISPRREPASSGRRCRIFTPPPLETNKRKIVNRFRRLVNRVRVSNCQILPFRHPLRHLFRGLRSIGPIGPIDSQSWTQNSPKSPNRPIDWADRADRFPELGSSGYKLDPELNCPFSQSTTYSCCPARRPYELVELNGIGTLCKRNEEITVRRIAREEERLSSWGTTSPDATRDVRSNRQIPRVGAKINPTPQPDRSEPV